MNIRLEKVEQGVPFSSIPVGHIAKGVVNNRRVLRVRGHGVLLPGFYCDPGTSFEGRYIDLGPIGDEQEPSPKRVPFKEIPVGHVGMAKDGNTYLRMKGGGVSFTEDWKGFIAIEHFNGLLYEDLGKLVVEP